MNDYEILHLKPGASASEIQQAYRDLVRVWHPDRFSGDPRLQKLADDKLKEINKSYLALERIVQNASGRTAVEGVETAPASPTYTAYPPTAQHKNIRLWVLFLVVLVGLVAVRIYAFLEGPMRELQSITADARRVAVMNGPSLIDAFAGWNGILPQGLDRLAALYQSTQPVGRRDVQVSRLPVLPVSPTTFAKRAVFRNGIGEIDVHNRTSEDVVLNIKATRVSGVRTISVPAQTDFSVGDLGPDLYLLDVNFPRSRRPPMRVGPFVMVEIVSAAATSGDRYEIILKP